MVRHHDCGEFSGKRDGTDGEVYTMAVLRGDYYRFFNFIFNFILYVVLGLLSYRPYRERDIRRRLVI